MRRDRQEKKVIRLLAVVLLLTVLTAGCAQKETMSANDGGAGSTDRADIVLPEEVPLEQIQEGGTQEGNLPADDGQKVDEPPQTEGGEADASGTEPAQNAPLPSQNTPLPSQNTDRTLLPVYRTRHIYGGILSMLAAAYELPDMEIDKQSLYDGIYAMSDNWFAVMDVDGDGREELIISYSTSSMAGMFEIVYGYDPDTMELTRELLEFVDTTFYDNGVVIAMASHNHSLNMSFWPYQVYQYNPQTDHYDFVAEVSSWNKMDGGPITGEAFPEEIDQDGDGIIYEIHTDLNDTEAVIRYDAQEFNEWTNQYMNGAEAIQIDFQHIAEDNFRKYATDHLSLLHDIAEKNTAVSQTDIGWYYIRQGSLDDAEQYLSDHYGVEWETNPGLEYVEEHQGSIGGNVVFWLVHMDGGILSYGDSRVEDITVFGIYPGMDADEAVMTLTSYGFFPYDGLENYMITGDGVGNAAISYNISDGVITGISVSAYCSYVG